jgi:hypothetical protein
MRICSQVIDIDVVLAGRSPDPQRGTIIVRPLRFAAAVLALLACVIVHVSAQAPQLVFTVPVPAQTPSEGRLQSSTAVEERGLALWAGTASDFGVGASFSGPRWTLRSITSMTALPVGNNARPTFQQVEVVRSIFSIGSTSLAGGGGVRQEWDGTRVFIGRVLAGSDIGGGRLQGSLVLERAVRSPFKRDGADFVTSLGWSRPIGGRISVGVEGMGQDLEGLWNRAEADGGAKLLVGPSFHARSTSGEWTASLTAGPVVHTLSTVSSPDAPAATYRSGGHHLGLFASASWLPSLRR